MPPRDPERGVSEKPLQLKILLFFSENEGSIDTPRGVATWINEPLDRVRPALEAMTEAGLLKAHRTSSTVGYSCVLSQQDLRKRLHKRS